MQDNSENTGTFSGNGGLSEADAQKIFNDVYGIPNAPEIKDEVVESAKAEVVEAAPAVVAEADSTKGTETPPDKQAEDPLAWLNSVSDESLKAKISEVLRERAEIKHKYDSDRGRIAQAREAVTGLRQELDQLRARVNKPQEQKPAAAQSKTDIPDNPEWSKIAEDDPTLARAVEKRANEIVEARLKQLAPELSKIAEERTQAALAPFERDRAEQRLQDEMYRLKEAVPNFEQVVSSPQYNEWLEYYATPEIAHMAQGADTYTKAITVLQAFEHYALNRFYGGQRPQAKSQEAAKAVVDTSVADKLAQERENKSRTGVAPGAARQTTPVGAGSAAKREPQTREELEKIFNEAYAKA